MRILVISDVHSNWVALQAIDEQFDRCLFVGDLVDYGTDPRPCVEWVRQHADATVRGNHDHAVAQRVPATGTTGYRRLAAATRPLHWDRLEPRILKYLGRLPVTAHYRADNRNFLLVHATPRDPMDEYLTANADAWRQRLQGIAADFVLVGHSHVPFHLDLGGVQVVNPGSVGQPRDGDPRASYAIIEDGQVSFHRASYDIDACLDQMRSTGIDDWAVRLSEAVLSTGGRLTREEMDQFV